MTTEFLPKANGADIHKYIMCVYGLFSKSLIVVVVVFFKKGASVNKFNLKYE